MQLTLYSDTFEVEPNFRGMNGKIFLEGNGTGKEFSTIIDAVMYAAENSINIEKVIYNYSSNGVQYFKTLKS